MTHIDPVTIEVIGSALSSIVEEMGEALIRASFSTNIKERRDCSTALFDLAGATLCQAEHIPMHLGSFLGLIPHIMKRHPIEHMRPGDVFCGNDAYEGGGTHLPDIVLAEPIFVDGEMTFWAVNLAHHADFADRGHAHIYQEGLRIPPIRLYRAGELQTDVQELILLNCQVPRERLSDFRAQMAANRLGVERMGRCAPNMAGTSCSPPAVRCRITRSARCARVSARSPTVLTVSPIPTTARKSMANRRGMRDLGARRNDALAFRRTAASSRRSQHDLHRVAVDGLLRGQSDRRSNHSTERGARASAAGDRARGNGDQLCASGRGEWAAQSLPTRCRSAFRCVGAGCP